MKKRLITLLTLGGALDRAKDRKGAYTLRYVNKLPKFGVAARAAAATAVAQPPASPAMPAAMPAAAPAAAPAAQPALFAAPKPPAEESHNSHNSHGNDGKDRTDRTDRTNAPVPANQPPVPAAPKARFLPFAKLSAVVAAAFAVVPKTAARVRGRLRSPAGDSRPRAQAELALEKVTVLRNDLSDADLVVVAVQPKAEDSRAAEAQGREPAGSPWTRVTARWVKQKKTASVAAVAQAERSADRAQTTC
jgi:hypothetical protein